MTKIQNRQRTQTNMKTLFVQELWNSRGIIPWRQRKVSGLSVKWSCLNNIIMGSDPANTWLDVHLSSCTSLVLLTSVPRFVTRKFRIRTDFAGVGLATAEGGNSREGATRDLKWGLIIKRVNGENWIYRHKYFGEIEIRSVFYYLAEKDCFLIVKFWNIHAQL